MPTIDGAYFDENDGVYRWEANDAIPFDDLLESEGVSESIRARCKELKDAETAAWIAEYRESQKNRVYSAEEMFEMRAAFGEGTEVVNVFTGQTVVV